MEYSAKILLLGQTGAGKSAFINYFLGKNVAKSAAGKPVTQEYFISYTMEDGRYPVEIFDTKGLETLDANNQMDYIIQEIKKRNNSDDIFDWFHTIFYCISMFDSRFEEFEVSLIKRLQQELTQHIHIILTQCDTCKPDSIQKMRNRITDKLGNLGHIEIFEVVCVNIEKLNGDVVQARGKEIVSERVFDLFLQDIAYKLSSNYAETLWNSFYQMLDDIFSDLDDFIDKTVCVGTLLNIIKDMDATLDKIDSRLDDVLKGLDDKMEHIQEQTDKKFTKILRPVAELYTSYWGIVTEAYLEDAELAFSDVYDWIDTEWENFLDEDEIIARVFPKVVQYVDINGEIIDGESWKGIIRVIGAAVGDIISLKKNLKNLIKQVRQSIIECLPSKNEIQTKAYERIVKYIRPEQQTCRDALQNVKEALGGAREGLHELIEVMEALNQCAEANDGDIPDVNEILQNILEENR